MRTLTWLLVAAAAAPGLALARTEQELSAPPLPESSPEPPPPQSSAPPPGNPAGVNTLSLDAAPAYSAAGRKVRLSLTDGQLLNCELLDELPDRVTVRIGAGAPFEISRASIRNIEPADGPVSPASWFRDPNVTRHFYAPTGFMLRQGECYFSQKELVFSSFGYGVTDNISILVGSVVPTWFAPSGQNLVAAFKVGVDAGDTWHVAGSAQGLLLPFSGINPPSAVGLLSLTATVGTPTLNFTASLGYMASTANLFFPFTGLNTAVIVVGASSRVAPNVALVTENWFFPAIAPPSPASGEPFFMLNSAGVRLMNDHLAADLGLIRIPGSVIPLPWVDFTYAFGY